jgi:Rieske 2Fe-2S family protein
MTLPGSYYTSQDVFDRETDRIFNQRWLCVGAASAIDKPGAYLVVEIEGESLLIVRGRDDAVRAFYNVCRHRGTQLCSQAGSVSKYITCPYHAWSYDLTGGLAAAPNMDEVEGFDRADFPLHGVAVYVWEGLIFINLAEEPDPFDVAMAPLIGKFSRWRLSELVPVHRTEYDVKANWKLLLQNYSECYHCPSLHPVLNRLTPYRDSLNDLEEGAVLGGPMLLSESNASMTMDGSTCAAPLVELTGDEARLVWYYVLFPSCFLSIMPDYVLVHRVLRHTPDSSTIICEWFFRPEAVDSVGFDPSGAIDFWDMTNRQDWGICQSAQQGAASRAYTPGPYAHLESMLAAMDREYLQSLGAG